MVYININFINICDKCVYICMHVLSIYICVLRLRAWVSAKSDTQSQSLKHRGCLVPGSSRLVPLCCLFDDRKETKVFAKIQERFGLRTNLKHSQSSTIRVKSRRTEWVLLSRKSKHPTYNFSRHIFPQLVEKGFMGFEH